MAISIDLRLVPIPGISPQPGLATPLGLLAPLTGKWVGTGFNQIFRPFHGAGSDNFLELNLTQEKLEFTQIPGEIPNRGRVQDDISLFGLTYLQEIDDANVVDSKGRPAGIHLEPGIWLNVPATSNPDEPPTVVRMATIPHGTSMVAQGTAMVFSGPPVFAPVDITPFVIGEPDNRVRFPSQTLADPSPFRSPDSDIVGITQAMLDDPNSILRDALGGKIINSTTVIQISTQPGDNTAPSIGGGVSEIAFLTGSGAANAHLHSVEATFWISDYTDAQGPGTLLQYSQMVLLDFGTLSWPHVSVATLIRQPQPSKGVKELKDTLEKVKEQKLETKEVLLEGQAPTLPFPPDPGVAGPAAAAPALGRHFIVPGERPAVGDPAAAEQQGSATEDR